ncbi:uncharacterized protein BJ212DRAFT_1281434, partial [Suillus subaureus]
ITMTLMKLPLLVPSVLVFNNAYISPATAPRNDETISGGPLYERICPVIFPILQRVLHTGQLPDMMPNRYFIMGTILVFMGCLGRMWCFRVMGRHFTHELSLRKDHSLVTAGPYNIVRHPGYAASWIASLGISLICASPGSFMLSSGWLSTYFGRVVFGVWVLQVILSVVLSFARSISEDAMLRKRFGGEWDRWSKRVCYRLIPGVF